MKSIDNKEYKMPTYDEIIQKGKKVIDDHNRQKVLLAQIKAKNAINNSRWFILYILIAAISFIALFSYKDVIFSSFADLKTKIGFNPIGILDKSSVPLNTTQLVAQNAVSTPEASTECKDEITITQFTDKNQKEMLSVCVIQIGQSYTIPPKYQTQWANIIDKDEDRFAKHILDNSNIKSLSQQEIESRLAESTKTWTLDLR